METVSCLVARTAIVTRSVCRSSSTVKMCTSLSSTTRHGNAAKSFAYSSKRYLATTMAPARPRSWSSQGLPLLGSIHRLATRPLPPAPANHPQSRHSSHSPLGTNQAPARKKVTLQTILNLYKRNEPITMMTAHDFPSAHVADTAGMDIVLVGDSLAMVALGMEDTSELLVEEMLLHCRSVSRGARSAFIVGDLPMGSYEISPDQALTTAIRFIKTGRCHAVKLEGGAEMATSIHRIVSAGIPVLAHIGLTPQRQHSLGGFRVQGKTVASASKVLADARAVQEAGAFGVVMEAMPEGVATLITGKLRIPTIGIGAGNGTSGQVLVQMDMSGFFPPGRSLPKFVKKYGDVWGEALRAVEEYGREVRSRAYPAKEHTYPMPKEELAAFERLLAEEEEVGKTVTTVTTTVV